MEEVGARTWKGVKKAMVYVLAMVVGASLCQGSVPTMARGDRLAMRSNIVV
jgi:hypothetical protein